MAIKKRVTYSVSYTAGVDTLTTKLNSLLQDIVALIMSHNSGLTVVDKIEVGSSRMTDAPLFDGGAGGIYSGYYDSKYYQSDVYFLGTSEDNLSLALCFYDGCLVISMNMTPKAEKAITDRWSEYGLSVPKLYAIGRFTRWYPDVYMGQAGNQDNYAIPYTNANGALSIGVIYWHTDYSSGYMFTTAAGEKDGINLVIYPTIEGHNITGIGAAICPFGLISPARWRGRFWLLTWSFSENLINNPPASIGGGTSDPDIVSTQVRCNQVNDTRNWVSCFNNEYGLASMAFVMHHILGLSDGNVDGFANYAGVIGRSMPQQYTVNKSYYPASSTANPESGTSYGGRALETAYNLPHLNPGQAYVRKMRIPGWNPDCKGEIYLLWSPVLTAYQSGDIVEVGSKSYAIITSGAVVWAARVS